MRLSGGISFGRNPQKFMMGGTENWINYQFEENRIPIESAEELSIFDTCFTTSWI